MLPGGERMTSEWELIEKAKTGDQAALSQLVGDCWQPLFRFITHKMGSADEAQDVVQETFFRAFRSLASYKQTDSRFTTYLGRIASNLITDMWRKKGRSPINSNVTDIQDRLAGGENPADALLATEKKQALAAALNDLPPEQRQVIEYRILAGLPVRDVALAMDKSEAAIKMLQQRALKNLREKLLAKGGWQEDEQ